MPYIEQAQRANLELDYSNLTEPGDLNYLITRMLIEGWKVAPRYSTIHKMYKDFVLSPEKNSALMAFYHSIQTRTLTRQDLFTASALAFFEFYRRIGQVYETIKILENGDVYKEVAEPLTLMLDELVKRRKQPLSLLLPK